MLEAPISLAPPPAEFVAARCPACGAAVERLVDELDRTKRTAAEHRETVRRLRAQGLTQGQIAVRLGITTQQVSKILHKDPGGRVDDVPILVEPEQMAVVVADLMPGTIRRVRPLHRPCCPAREVTDPALRQQSGSPAG